MLGVNFFFYTICCSLKIYKAGPVTIKGFESKHIITINGSCSLLELFCKYSYVNSINEVVMLRDYNNNEAIIS